MFQSCDFVFKNITKWAAAEKREQNMQDENGQYSYNILKIRLLDILVNSILMERGCVENETFVSETRFFACFEVFYTVWYYFV